MKKKIVHLIAKTLGGRIKIDEVPYGARPVTGQADSPPTTL